ncbi:MAG: DUF1989 domain-containing protein [Thermovirgaceae bacterium]
MKKFTADDLSEKLSPSHTRLALHSIKFKVDDALLTNLRRPMMEIVEDTAGTYAGSPTCCCPLNAGDKSASAMFMG